MGDEDDGANIDFLGYKEPKGICPDLKLLKERTMISDTAVTNSSEGIKPLSRPVRFRSALRNTVHDVMRARNWIEIDSEGDQTGQHEWDVFWADVHWIFENFAQIPLQDHQRINHFRNHYELTRKDLLAKNIKRMLRHMERQFDETDADKFNIIPKTFVVPKEHGLFREEFKKNTNQVWIMKPVGRSQGRGIFLISRLQQINQWIQQWKKLDEQRNEQTETPVESYIVQRYIDNPYLIGGRKFDMRIYVLVISFDPLVVYLHRIGFCRFSTHPFSNSKETIGNLYMHATNVAVQKTSPDYDKDRGCKWSLKNLRLFLASKHGVHVAEKAFNDVEGLIVRSLLSVQKVMIQDKHCFELYGYDVLFDENLRPWLLEINASPSLSVENQLDYESKFIVLNDLFNVIDMERLNGGQIRKVVGGFDLIYNNGAVSREKANIYASNLGGKVEWVHRPLRKSKPYA